jgi:hypothetical protein
MTRARILVALPILIAFGLCASPAVSTASPAGHFAEVLDTPSTLPDPGQSGQRNSYVVLQSWETVRAAELKAANPNLVVLAYQNLGAITEGQGPGGTSSSGVNFSEANTAHPEWFLKEANGTRIAEEGYSWLWMADIGEASYQQQWTANVIHLLQSGPWDGVMMDDTNTTPKYHVSPQSRIAKYPTDAAYQAAVRSMLAYAGPKIQAVGKLAIPNIGSWTAYPAVAKEWLQYVSGGEDEMFVKWSSVPGEGYRSAGDWKAQLEEARSTEAMGKRFLAITQAEPTDTRAMRYGWASALLDGNGHTAFLTGDTTGYNAEAWSSEYEVALGEPTAEATEIGAGVWARRFQDGLVLVNPSSAAAQVSFGGTYSGDGLTDATEATVGSDTALILTGIGSGNKGNAPGSSGTTGTGSSGGGSAGTPSQETSPSSKGGYQPLVNTRKIASPTSPRRAKKSRFGRTQTKVTMAVISRCRRQVSADARRRAVASRVEHRDVASCVRAASTNARMARAGAKRRVARSSRVHGSTLRARRL